MKNTILLLIAVLVFFPIFGQDLKSKQDSASVISYYDRIMLKANIDTRTDSYLSKSLNSNDDELNIRNNNALKMFFNLNYRFLSVSFGFAPEFLPGNNDDQLKGESSFSDIKFRLFFGNWIQELHYSKVSGFYVVNTGDFFSGWQKDIDPYFQFPGISITSWGGTTGYVMNPKYSLKSLYFKTEWQKKSSGSFIPSISYYYDHYSLRFKEYLGSDSIENIFTLSSAISYYYTMVIHNKWYVAPYATAKSGVKFSNFKYNRSDNDTAESHTYFTIALEGGIQIGYNTPRLFFGSAFNINSNWYTSSENNRLINDKIYGAVYVGYRFNAPKFIANTFDKAEDKLKL